MSTSTLPRPLALLLAVTAILACGSPEPGPEEPEADTAPADVRAEAGETFALGHGQRAVVGPARLEIVFREVAEESRCPEGAECPTAGNAAIRFGVETSDGATATITLNTHRRPREVTVLDHTIRLGEVEPYPDATAAPPDRGSYRATLTVEPTA
ncbi:MAG: hypothetical protein R3199_02525 [Gemmatimonadota bacterium]|nr:hypothetical protein [Gemmatimonadota bacterium]